MEFSRVVVTTNSFGKLVRYDTGCLEKCTSGSDTFREFVTAEVQVRDKWRVLVSTVMNFRVPLNAGSSGVAAQLTASQEGPGTKSE
jgi:hypothetical protein